MDISRYFAFPPGFAFDETSAWGKAYLAFLHASYERSGSMSTLKRYRQALNLFFSEPSKMPDRYTREEVLAYLHSPGLALGRVGQPVKSGVYNNRLSTLHCFYAFAMSYTVESGEGELIPLMNKVAPTTGIKKVQSDRPPYKSLSEKELAAFFAAIPVTTVKGIRDRAMFLFYLMSARRRNEVRNLTWGDIQQATIVEKDGTNRTAWVYSWYGKGHQRQVDSAELPQTAKDAIDWYLIASGRMDTIKPEDPLFVSIWERHQGQGQKPISAHDIHYLIKSYAKAAGIPPAKISTHSFRHTSARMRLESGADVREVQRTLRHSSLATTDLYVRQLQTAADPRAQQLEKRFGNL